MNWDDLRFLVAVGHAGSLAAAARQLQVDQTTVGRRIRALEQALGATLFEHDGNRWQPTAAGARALARAAYLEEEIADLVLEAERDHGSVSGVVRVTSTPDIITDYLSPRLGSLQARHPGLTLELVASNDNLSVARRETDIAIRLARPAHGSFFIRKLADCRMAIYVAAGPTMDVKRWVAYTDALAHTPEMRWLREQPDVTLSMRCDSMRAIAAAVAAGVGQGVLPCFMADAHPGLRRRPGRQPQLSRDIWLLVHRGARRQPRVKAVTDWLGECFSADAARFRGEPGADGRAT